MRSIRFYKVTLDMMALLFVDAQSTSNRSTIANWLRPTCLHFSCYCTFNNCKIIDLSELKKVIPGIIYVCYMLYLTLV